MASESRGLVLIINIENFKTTELPRKGSQLDVDRLNNVFGNLKFEVIEICTANITIDAHGGWGGGGRGGDKSGPILQNFQETGR